MGVLTSPIGFIAASTSRLSSQTSSGVGSERAGRAGAGAEPDRVVDTAAAALNNSAKFPTPFSGLRLFLSPLTPPQPPLARRRSIDEAGNIRRFLGEDGVEFCAMALTLMLALARVLALVLLASVFALWLASPLLRGSTTVRLFQAAFRAVFWDR